MAEQVTSFVDEANERFTAARERVDSEVQRIQKDLQTRRKQLEKQITSSRKSFEKQTRKQVKQIEKDLRANSIVKTLEDWRCQANQALEDGVVGVLDALQIASKNDLKKIDRKITKLTKQLKDVQRVRTTNGRATTPPQA